LSAEQTLGQETNRRMRSASVANPGARTLSATRRLTIVSFAR